MVHQRAGDEPGAGSPDQLVRLAQKEIKRIRTRARMLAGLNTRHGANKPDRRFARYIENLRSQDAATHFFAFSAFCDSAAHQWWPFHTFPLTTQRYPHPATSFMERCISQGLAYADDALILDFDPSNPPRSREELIQIEVTDRLRTAIELGASSGKGLSADECQEALNTADGWASGARSSDPDNPWDRDRQLLERGDWKTAARYTRESGASEWETAQWYGVTHTTIRRLMEGKETDEE